MAIIDYILHLLGATVLVIGWICTVILPKAEEFWESVKVNLRIYQLLSCSFVKYDTITIQVPFSSLSNTTQTRTFMHMRVTPTCHELVCHGVLCYIHESDAFINGLLAGSWFCRWCQWTGVLWQCASSFTIEGLWVMTMALNSLLILTETKCL